ncbi:Phage-related minor tail protein [Gimesia panareensis]|uniref:Phage-related minor tail protein n=1 Tax=Gimesia panareensis TaxID=2527978 RepID=A0A517Q5A5_9PLAN|nr:phage tail tape measure protein [Gimesia panareensis]QDT26796.1 Phage-related minor tail protein [Gimesia panareensis]
MTNKIQMDLSVRDAQMVAAWKRSTQSIAAFNKELDKIGQKQRRNRSQSNRFFKGMTTNLASMAAGYISVAGAAGLLINANRDIINQTDEVARKYDEIFRKFRVQSGLKGLEGDAARGRILDIAERQAFPSEQASNAATQLVSSGFSPAEASGGSLEEFLRILNASNVTGKEVDPTELAKAISSYLESQGLAKNEKNVAMVGRRVQALFKGTNLQLPDLAELATVSEIFNGLLTVEEQLGTFSTLVQSIPAAEAKTGFRNFVLRLNTVTDDQKTKVKALDQLGLKKEDVDFVGEDLGTILDRLAVGLDKLPKEKRAPVLNQIFGERTIAVAQSMINRRKTIEESYGIQDNVKGFLSDVDEATSGRNAAERRATVRLERRRFAQDKQDSLKVKELSELEEKEGVSPLRRDINEKGYYIARYLGAEPDTALNIINPLDWGSVSDAVDQSVETRAKPASEYGTGEAPPPAPPAPSPNTVTPQQLERLQKDVQEAGFEKVKKPADDNIPAAPVRGLRNLIYGDAPPRNTIPIPNWFSSKPKEQAPAPTSEDASFNPVANAAPAINPASTDQLTKALQENTAAIKAAQDNKKPAESQKPVQVKVSVSADTSTAPNGPRASAALARPAK